MEQLGINPVLIVAQLISFGVLFFVFNKFLFPKIQDALNERKTAIAAALSGKAEMENKLLEFQSEQAKLKEEESKKAKAIILETKKQAEIQKAEIIAAGYSQSKNIKEKAEHRLITEMDLAKQELTSYTKKMAVEIAKKSLLSGASDPKWQHEVIKSSLTSLAKQVSE